MHVLTIGNNNGKSVAPLPKWVVGEVGGSIMGGLPVGGLWGRCGCWLLCWLALECYACKSWSHICSSWYLPKFLLRGVLDADKHGFLYGPRLTVHFFMHNIKLVGVQGMS